MAVRSLSKTVVPFQALYNLIEQKRLPAPSTVAGNVPYGMQASYDFTGITGNTVAEAQAKILDRVQTSGLNVVLTQKPEDIPWYRTALNVIGGLFSFTSAGGALSYTAKGLAYQDTNVSQTAATLRGSDMGLFDDIWGGVQNAASNIFPSNAGIDWNGLLQQGVGLATQALAPRQQSYAAPMQTSMAPAMSAAGAVARIGGAAVSRGFFGRFPNLATAVQQLRNSGMNVSRAKLYGVMKRFGPEFLVTGGLLTAAAVNELAVAGPGYRRMNPANVRALRRSVRRIESFHRLCKTTDRLRGSKRRK